MSPVAQTSLAAVDYAFWLAYGWPWYVAAFLIGSIPFGLIVGRMFFKTDIRAAGSGNIGAANAMRTMGRGAGISVLVLDALKGIIATALPLVFKAVGTVMPFVSARPPTHGVSPIFNHTIEPFALCAMCALAAILGHCYSPWLRFKGGKGVATLLGVFLIACWPSAVAFIAVWLAIVVPTGYASLGSMVGTVIGVVVIALVWGTASLPITVPATLLVIWKHRENISRLVAGRESKLSLLKR